MHILLATDGSDCARAALDFLARFPFPQDSTATLLTVVDEAAVHGGDRSELTEEQTHLVHETVESVREEAQQVLAAESLRLQQAGWTCAAAEVRSGNPAEEIIGAAEALGADLVVVGSHGWTGIKRFLLGSVSHKLLQHAPCSVLVVKQPRHGDELEEPWRILVAYDGSAPAQSAIELCAGLPLDADAEVTAIRVLPLVTLYRQDIRQRLDPIWQQKKKTAQAALENVVASMKWPTANVSAQLREGADISATVLETAAETRSNLLMLGCKGTGAVKRFVLGSITHHVARHATCSVWVVRD